MANHKDNPENEGENQNEGNNADENFGLPELDYKPLDSTEESTTTSSSLNEESINQSEEYRKSYSYTPVEEPKSNAPIIIAIIIGLVLIVSGFLIYQYWYKPKAEKAKKELLAKQESDRKQKEEQARLAKEKEEAERKRLEEEKAAAVPVAPPEGTIETLSGRTGRYYVVISSDIDDDLIMDFAKKLSAQGISSRIIPPGKKKFYRLTIGSFDTFADAQVSADQEKPKYGDGLWVIKY